VVCLYDISADGTVAATQVTIARVAGCALCAGQLTLPTPYSTRDTLSLLACALYLPFCLCNRHFSLAPACAFTFARLKQRLTLNARSSYALRVFADGVSFRDMHAPTTARAHPPPRVPHTRLPHAHCGSRLPANTHPLSTTHTLPTYPRYTHHCPAFVTFRFPTIWRWLRVHCCPPFSLPNRLIPLHACLMPPCTLPLPACHLPPHAYPLGGIPLPESLPKPALACTLTLQHSCRMCLLTAPSHGCTWRSGCLATACLPHFPCASLSSCLCVVVLAVYLPPVTHLHNNSLVVWLTAQVPHSAFIRTFRTRCVVRIAPVCAVAPGLHWITFCVKLLCMAGTRARRWFTWQLSLPGDCTSS